MKKLFRQHKHLRKVLQASNLNLTHDPKKLNKRQNNVHLKSRSVDGTMFEFRPKVGIARAGGGDTSVLGGGAEATAPRRDNSLREQKHPRPTPAPLG